MTFREQMVQRGLLGWTIRPELHRLFPFVATPAVFPVIGGFQRAGGGLVRGKEGGIVSQRHHAGQLQGKIGAAGHNLAHFYGDDIARHEALNQVFTTQRGHGEA